LIYFTADQHFNHYKIIEYCKRPFQNVQEMNDALVSNWNSVVNSRDLVFILGDFAMRNADDYAIQLNGTKVFLCGNHDKRWVISALRIISGCTRIFMQHSPYLKEVPEPIDLILCGHVHDKWIMQHWNKIPMINVGVDVWNYKPVSLSTIKNYALTLPKEVLPESL
jgi:calcineurin-like phosphoesterase family protein